MLSDYPLTDPALTDRSLSNQRLILYHKHSFSGKTLFLRLNETICQFDGISATSRVVASQVGGNQVADDPALAELLTDAEHRLGLSSGSLILDREFNAAIDDAETLLQIYLARFTAIDPPQEQIAEQGGKLIALTEARRFLPPTELELLGLAYSTIMDELA